MTIQSNTGPLCWHKWYLTMAGLNMKRFDFLLFKLKYILGNGFGEQSLRIKFIHSKNWISSAALVGSAVLQMAVFTLT